MPRADYDPAKAHEYYERTKKLKGRLKRATDQPPARRQASPQQVQSAQAKVAQIEAKLNHLRELLRAKVADEKKSSTASKKPTQADKLKDRKDSAHYRATHQQQIKNLAKGKSSGGSSSSKPKTAADMSASELRTAISHVVTQLKQAITDAKRLRGG
jgi:hypothetical protein